MIKKIFLAGVSITLLAFTTLPVRAQQRVFVSGTERQQFSNSVPYHIKSSITSMVTKKGYIIGKDSLNSDLKISFSASSDAGKTTGNLTFAYVNAEVDLLDLKSRREISRIFFTRIKGGGVDLKSAEQSAFQAAGRKIADTLEKVLTQSQPAAIAEKTVVPKVVIQPSDVDLNIPSSTIRNDKTFALIIGNEDYKTYQQGLNDEVNVDFAMQDATTFKSYVNRTLGVPEENIKLLINARSIEMHRELKKLVSYIKALNGSAEIIFFYAGHGLPDETTKEPYLIPVDVVGTDLQFAMKLTSVYSELASFPAKRVTIFIDACFTGGARNQALIAARGVKVKPKTDALTGNLVVFSASSGDQSSMAFKAKNHGMFTYYLLKKIQECRGNISYKALSEYLSREVALQSVRVNNKEQNPQVSFSDDVREQWESWMLKQY